MTSEKSRFLLENGLPATIAHLDPKEMLNFLKAFSKKDVADYLVQLYDCVLVTVSLKGETVCLAYLEHREKNIFKFRDKLRQNLEKGRWNALVIAFFTLYKGAAYPIGNPTARAIQNAIRQNIPPR